MTTAKLIAALGAAGVQLWLDDEGQLRFKAPKGALTPELKQSLVDAKQDVIDFLRQTQVKPETRIAALPRGGDDRLPLSFAQQRLWFLDRLDPGNPSLHITAAIKIIGTLDIATMQRALEYLVARHESLRTTFLYHNNEVSQVITPPTPWPFSENYDLSALSVEQRDKRLREIAADEALRSFDLTEGTDQPYRRTRLFRTRLARLTPHDAATPQHVLFFNMHHVISDGWSMALMVRELSVIYEALTAGKQPPLPELTIQYPDFAAWQRQWMSGDAAQKQLAYWKQTLAHVPVLELPTDLTRPNKITHHGANIHFDIPQAVAFALHEYANRSGKTLFMVMLAAFQVLLHRYTGQDEFAVGTPIANRTRSEVEPLIGCFINLLALRSSIDGSMTFDAVVEQLHATALAAYDHQALPFELIVDELSGSRNLAFTPIFQVVFTMQNSSLDYRLKISGLDIELMPLDSHTAKYDIQLHIAEDANTLQGEIEFNTSLFTTKTIEQFAQHYVNVLAAATQDPTLPVGRITLLTAAEEQCLLQDFNTAASSALPVPQLTPIHTRFEKMAQQFAQRTAITLGAQSITYDVLNQRANQVAHLLRAQGVTTGDFVGLCLERSIDLIVALLGILKAGAAYVPLDPHFPAERLQYILSDSVARALITQQSLLETLPGFGGARIIIDSDANALAKQPTHNPDVPVPLDSTIYIIYTSGTTGKPKGCVLNHGNVARLFTATDDEFGFNENDVWTLFHSFAFDFSVWEIWGALLFGGRLVIVPYAVSRAPDEFYQLLLKEGVTVLNQTPSAFSQLVAIDATQPEATRHQLRCVVFGGEALDFNALRPWVKRYGLSNTRLINMYGITETTVHVTYYPLSLTDFEQGGSIVGKPIRDLHVHLLDAQRQLVPVGVAGEIYVSGPGVSDGYLNRADLTAERFIDNPFVDLLPEALRAQHRTLYKSGDLARLRDNGDIEYLGRIDLQVKIRGHRIELGEIEAQIAALDGVREACVMAREDTPGDQRLVAYLLPQAGTGDIDLAQIRTKLKITLPDYMLPAAFVVVPQWPLTPNGKLNKQALPAPDYSQVSNTPYTAPRNLTEEMIAQIWSAVLGVPEIGIYDNFFELGGHSLLATHLAARIGQAFGIELPLRTVFENPTIAGIAEHIDAGQTLETALNNAPDIVRIDRTQALPLSFAQQRLWIIDQFQPGNAAYNIPAGMVLHGALDTRALEAALNGIVERHESLRTFFGNDHDGGAVQIISDASAFRLQHTDLSPSSDALTQARAMFDRDASSPFDLRSGPLFRAHLIKTGVDQHVLILNMHHIISDGWSLTVFQRELTALYDAFCAGKPSPLPPLALQYADFAAWQHNWLNDTALQRHLDYWVHALSGAPALLKLPTDRPRPATQTFNGARFEFEIPPTLLARAREFSTAQNATIYSTLLAAFKLTLSQYAHMDDICIGTPVAGRDKAEIRDLIGYFVNTVVVRTRLEGNPTVVELIERVKDASLGAFAHQDVPIEKVLDVLQLERNLSYPPVAQVGFSFINESMASLLTQLGSARIEALSYDTVIAKYDLTLVMIEKPQHMLGVVEYNTDLFDATTIVRMMRHFVQLLEQCLVHSDWAINNLSMLTHAELCEATGANPITTEKILPLTPMQSDLYLYQQMNPNTRSNQMGYHSELPFALDIERLRAAFQTLADNSTTLRTTIRSNRFAFGDIAYQCIAKPTPITLEYIDLSARSLSGVEVSGAEVQARIHEFIYKPYRLEDEPPLRYNITKLGDARYLAMMGMHHAVTDGIGCVVHGQAVTNYYTALAQGVTPDALPKIPDNYVDYIFQNRAQMDVQAVQDYWREQYANCDALDFVLKDKALPEKLRSKGRGEPVVKTIDIPPEHWKAVEAYCKQQKSSPVHYFRSLYGILIKAYCRAENDFAIAEFFAGRDSRTVMMTQGCFFQQTPFIFRRELLGEDARFDALLKYAREFRKDSRKFQAISMSLANRLRPAGRINFMYNFYTFYTRNEMMDGHAVSPREHPPYVEQNVQLVVKTLGSHGFLDLYFQNDSFADLRLLERMISLSQQILDGTATIRDLDLVLPDEKQQQLIEWNRTHVPLPQVASLQAMVEQQVAATPDAIAVIDDHGTLTYRQLNLAANQLAHYLRHLGIGSDTRVGVCLSRSNALMVALLGIVKAGGAYVPMDVNYPSERLLYMAHDAHAPVMIIERCMREQFAGSDCTLIVIDDADDAHNTSIKAQPQDNPTNNTESDDLLYIIYTSGSTGRPKGASVVHRGEINLLNWYVRDFGFDASARSLIISASGFDLTQKNLWAPLVSGGAVVLPELPQYDAQAIAELIAQHKITSINCAPSAFYGVVDDCKDLAQLSSLRYVIFGGEPIRLEKLQGWLDSPQCKAQVVNNYGPTECTDIAAFHRVDNPALYYNGNVPVGRPNDNVQVYIVNDDLQLLPTGVIGELCIGGEGVGRGYLNNDDLNREKFVGNPFGTGQLYRSGDLMRFDDDGLLDFIGRKDFQIKLNGLRIELGEIEHALRQQQGVSDALVTVIDNRLIAYVTADARDIDRSGWQQSLGRHLPNYMIPQSIMVLAQWPLTPNGKIDRKALPLPDEARGRPEFVAPRNDTEQQIADIVCRVLGLSQVGMHDNFFDLGGHSLAASRAMAQMRETFALDIPLSVLFELTTIEKLAEYIRASVWAQQAQAPIENDGARDEGFL